MAQQRADVAEQKLAVASAAEPSILEKARKIRPDLFPEPKGEQA